MVTSWPPVSPQGALERAKGTMPGALADRQTHAAPLAVNPNVTNFCLMDADLFHGLSLLKEVQRRP